MNEELVPLGRTYVEGFATYADRPAVRDSHGEHTYGELGGRVRKLASALRAAGLVKGDRVILISDNSAQWATVERAVIGSGLVRVALLTRLHPNELKDIAANADPRAVFLDAGWLATNGREWIPESVETVVAMGDGPVTNGAVPFEDFLEGGADEPIEVDLALDDLAAILYTSGSTGKPKGVKLTQGNAAARARNIRHELPQLGDHDVALHTAPTSHFSGGFADAVTAAGGLNILDPKFEKGKVVDLALSGEITVLPLVPTMINMVLEELEGRGEPTGAVGNVKIVPYAGSAIQPDRAAKATAYFGEAMQQLYGASEAQMPIAALSPADHVDVANGRGLSRLASAGRVTDFVEVAIVDSEHQPVAAGETGEIATRGSHVGPGYWRNDAATAENFEDGWCFTGDVGYIDENGFLFILDRRKDMIISGGFNVFPREIENVVSAMPGVREVAVLGAPDPKWGEVITAFVSVAPDSGITADDVTAYCRDNLGGYKVPKSIRIVDELPKLGTGKIDRVSLRDELWEGRERRV